MGFFIDERADDSQREALETIFGGDAGGWPAGFAELIEDVLGIEYAPIEFEIADDLAAGGSRSPGRRGGGPRRWSARPAPRPRCGPQRARAPRWARASRDVRNGERGRSRRVRVQVELARSVEQALPLRWSGPDEA